MTDRIRPCPECNGTGYFAIDARGAHILDCDHCDGTGLAGRTTEQQVDSSRTIQP